MIAAMLGLGSAVLAEDRGDSGPSIVSHTEAPTVAKRGVGLKWVPYRTDATAERVARAPAPASAETGELKPIPANEGSAMGDPFGDKQGELVMAAPAEPIVPLPKPPTPLPKPPTSTPFPTQPNPKEPMMLPGLGEQPTASGQLPNPRTPSVPSGVDCPPRTDTDFFTPIDQLTPDLKARPRRRRFEEGSVPLTAKPEECKLEMDRHDPRESGQWACMTFTWKASALCNKPLYFEDVEVERYGHAVGPILQPVLSTAHFFVSVPLLPYNMGLTPPAECMYSLGYYRPGSCAPYLIETPPLSLRAAAAEAGAWAGLILLVP
jgi:hypothetical protein